MITITFRENGITLTGHKLDTKENTCSTSSITIDYEKIIKDKSKRINEFVNKYGTINKTFVIQDNIKGFNERIGKYSNVKVGEYKLDLVKNEGKKVSKRPRKEVLENSIKYAEETLSHYIKRMESVKNDIEGMKKELKSLNKKKKRILPVLPTTEEKSHPGTKYYSIGTSITGNLEVNRYRFTNSTGCYNDYIADNFFRTREEANKVVNSYKNHLNYEFKKKKILNTIIRYADTNSENNDKTYSDYSLPFTYNQVVSIIEFIEDIMYGRYDNKINHMIYMIERMDGDRIKIIKRYYPQFNENSKSLREIDNSYMILHDLITNALAAGDGSKIFFSRKEAVNSYTVRNWKKIFPNAKVEIYELK